MTAWDRWCDISCDTPVPARLERVTGCHVTGVTFERKRASFRVSGRSPEQGARLHESVAILQPKVARMCYAGIPCPDPQPENHTNFLLTGRSLQVQKRTQLGVKKFSNKKAVAGSLAEQDHVEHEVRIYVVRGLANLAHLACFKSTTTPYFYATACAVSVLELH